MLRRQTRQLKASYSRAKSRLSWLARPAEIGAIKSTIEALRPRSFAADLVRIGPNHDGGYLLPNDFKGIVGCISPGVSQEVGFDLNIAERGIDVFMLDASVGGPPISHSKFHFTQKYLGDHESDIFTRLETVCSGSDIQKGDLILQMDIEGAEWDVFRDTDSSTLARFRIIVVELHDLHEIFGQVGFQKMEPILRKLLLTHSVVHLHPNNMAPLVQKNGVSIPPLLEMTLLRNDRKFNDSKNVVLPNPLDYDCKSKKPPVTLPPLWWSKRTN